LFFVLSARLVRFPADPPGALLPLASPSFPSASFRSFRPASNPSGRDSVLNWRPALLRITNHQSRIPVFKTLRDTSCAASSGSCRRGRWAATAAAGARSGCPSAAGPRRSEEHTSELQSRENLVCRLLLEQTKH